MHNTIMINWVDKFDQIYCIRFLPCKNDRDFRIQNELKRVGILDSGILSYKNTFLSPWQEVLRHTIPLKHRGLQQKRGNFNCAYAHYEIYKEALGLGYKRILVLEEDIVFLKNLVLLQQIFDNFPDYDVVLFDKFVYNPYEYIRDVQIKQNIINNFFVTFNAQSTHYGSGACYSVNSTAMNAFITQQERQFFAADELWNDWTDNVECNKLTKAFSILNAGYQQPFPNTTNTVEQAYSYIQLDKTMYVDYNA